MSDLKILKKTHPDFKNIYGKTNVNTIIYHGQNPGTSLRPLGKKRD